MGIIANDKFKGMTLRKLIENYNEDIFEKTIKNRQFPLLVKLINYNKNLSVQVHTNDEYARRLENSYRKTEAWYVVDSKEEIELVVETNGCTKEQFEEAIKNGDVEKSLYVIDFDSKPERLVENYEEFEGYNTPIYVKVIIL